MPSIDNRSYPRIESIRNQPDLARELQTLRQMIYTLQDGQQAKQPTATPATGAPSAELTPAQLDQIRKALQIGGSHPLNTTGLLS